MHFHRVHGSAIALSDDKLVATRKEDFCNGLAFSSQPLKIGQKICIELTQVSEWSSAIRIGVTSEDPGKLCSEDLPRYACPDLTKKSGHWARALSEKYADTGNRITFYVNSSGQMHYFVNNEHKGALLSHLPTAVPLWTLFDIYGNTNSAKFVPADEVPVEILARGPDALSAYHQACESGTQPVFRTRLMLVGQDRVGKTSLKKSLMGQRHDTAEASTGGIDLSASCSFNVTDRKAWKVALKGDASEAISETQSPGLKGLGSREDLEEEYHQAIASNIVQELLYRKKQREKDEREQDGRDSERRNSKTSSATIRGVPRETDRYDYEEDDSWDSLSEDEIEQNCKSLNIKIEENENSISSKAGSSQPCEQPQSAAGQTDQMLKGTEESSPGKEEPKVEANSNRSEDDSMSDDEHSSEPALPHPDGESEEKSQRLIVNWWCYDGTEEGQSGHQPDSQQDLAEGSSQHDSQQNWENACEEDREVDPTQVQGPDGNDENVPSGLHDLTEVDNISSSCDSQPHARPETDHTNSQYDSQPGIDHTNSQFDSQHGVDHTSSQYDSQPGVDHTSSQYDSEPGVDHTSSQYDSQPGEDHTNRQCDSQPGIDHTSSQYDSQPGIDHTNRQYDSQPGIDHTSSQYDSQAAVDHANSQYDSQPGIDHTNRQYDSQPGIDHTNRQYDSQPGIDHTNSQFDSQAAVDHTNSQYDNQSAMNHTSGPHGVGPALGDVSSPYYDQSSGQYGQSHYDYHGGHFYQGNMDMSYTNDGQYYYQAESSQTGGLYYGPSDMNYAASQYYDYHENSQYQYESGMNYAHDQYSDVNYVSGHYHGNTSMNCASISHYSPQSRMNYVGHGQYYDQHGMNYPGGSQYHGQLGVNYPGSSQYHGQPGMNYPGSGPYHGQQDASYTSDSQSDAQYEMSRRQVEITKVTFVSRPHANTQHVRKKKERVSASGRRDTMKDDLKFHELVQEVPQRVVELVEGMIHEKENSETHGKPELDRSTSGKNITLNIWDFAGQAIYHTTHQVFLSSRAVYIIVFNLCHDLDEPAKTLVRRDTLSQVEWEQSEFSNLDFMDFWMSCIHGHTAQNTRNSVDNTTLSPPVFIVGTHRNSLSDQKQTQSSLVEDKFRRIREMMQQKPYWHHIIPHFYAVENNVDSGEDQQVVVLRRHIEEVASKEPYMGERMPIKWLKIEQAVQQLVEGATHFVSLDQIREVAQGEGVTADDEFKTLLEFYHDLGVIIYYGGPSTLDNVLRNTVILQPQWLIDMFKRVIASNMSDQQWGNFRDSWLRLDKSGILEERLIDHLWKDALSQKPALLGLMEKFDLVCHRLPSEESREAEIVGRTYYVPLRLRPHAETFKLYSPSKEDVVFYYDFNGFLPDGLFHRIVTRAVRWSQEHSKPLPHMPQLSHRKARLYLDEEHDFVLEMAPAKQARIKVVALREVDLEESDDASTDSEEKPLPPPKPSACAKARNFLESVLSDLREMWMKRISYQACVQCPCDKVCKLHDKPKCPEPSCVHFLNLDECLSNKIVCCDYRRVKTSVFRKWFPAPVPIVKQGPILPDTVMQETYGNIEATKGSELPSWVKSAAKLLNGGSEGQDWTALAKKLGYKKTKMEKFNDDLNPALALITDWIISSGNTALSVDMMVSCLEQMQRDDIVDIIQKGQESEIEPPQVFISYQWDSQDDVRALRDKLEKSGLSCWMDIGQMGGGDQLYARIDKGIRNSKVVIACVTPKYVVSHHCNRELSLADLLRKPIIPVMYESVAWPPPGGMSLMLTQLVYINMKGVGGHGGSGIHADLEDKYQEVIQRVCCYAVPDPNLCSTQQSPCTEPTKTSDQFISEPSMHSESLGSPLSVADPAVIPGYVQQDFVHHHPPTGRGHLNEPAATGNQGPGPPIPVPRPQGVEQVHVTKCAVCTIL